MSPPFPGAREGRASHFDAIAPVGGYTVNEALFQRVQTRLSGFSLKGEAYQTPLDDRLGQGGRRSVATNTATRAAKRAERCTLLMAQNRGAPQNRRGSNRRRVKVQ